MATEMHRAPTSGYPTGARELSSDRLLAEYELAAESHGRTEHRMFFERMAECRVEVLRRLLRTDGSTAERAD